MTPRSVHVTLFQRIVLENPRVPRGPFHNRMTGRVRQIREIAGTTSPTPRFPAVSLLSTVWLCFKAKR